MWLKIVLSSFLLSAVTSQTISEQKCKEYAKAVYTQEESPVLLPNARTNLVSQCGIVEVPLIVGGIKAQHKEYPHMAVIGFGMSPNENLSWSCGGSLISESFVLTAAHCMKHTGRGPAQKVKLGAISLESTSDTQEILISARIPHPDFKPPIKYNDIALLKLITEVQFTPFVRPACLNANPNISNRKAIATGFGKLSFDSQDGSNYLMKVQLNLIPNSQCDSSFNGAAEKLRLPRGLIDSMLCAGDLAGGKDTCQGDSGGPLQIVLNDPYCMYNLIGITSFGKFCGFANSPGIYTKISDYLEWIEKNVWG